jgi:hypothetical protein
VCKGLVFYIYDLQFTQASLQFRGAKISLHWRKRQKGRKLPVRTFFGDLHEIVWRELQSAFSLEVF